MASLPIKYPIYIISKGRSKSPLTANIFLKHGVPFNIAVEPQEYELYCAKIGIEYVLKLPFSNLGLGSYPARNWCWQHSMDNGHKKHFLFDDNIQSFASIYNGKRKYNIDPKAALSALEKFHDQFSNLAISGYNYAGFATKTTNKAFNINTHVYSGMLINNEIPFRWRMKYNEDVDLCLQALHTRKWATVLINAYLIDKVSTSVKMKGGNQDDLYKNNSDDMKRLKANSLRVVWPQYVRVVSRFGRPHHFIGWKKHFNHPLMKIVPSG